MESKEPGLMQRFENQSTEVESLRRKSQRPENSSHQQRGFEFHLRRAQANMQKTGDQLWSNTF